MDGRKIGRIAALISFPLLIGATIAVVVIFRTQLWAIFSSPEKIQQTVQQLGIRAPLGFILLQFIQVVIFVIPGEIPEVAGGYLFGMWKGVIYSSLGIVLGSAFNFYAARLLGVPFVKALFKKEQLDKFGSITHSPRAQIAFFLFFVIPGIPKDVLCYVAGLSSLRFPAFLIISTVGRLPAIIGSAGMGHAAASKQWVLAVVIFAAAVVLFVLGLIFKDKVHGIIERFALKRSEGEPDSGDSVSGS